VYNRKRQSELARCLYVSKKLKTVLSF